MLVTVGLPCAVSDLCISFSRGIQGTNSFQNVQSYGVGCDVGCGWWTKLIDITCELSINGYECCSFYRLLNFWKSLFEVC